MHPSIVRRINATRIFHTLRVNPGISQREIGERTGVDKSTISAIISHFDGIGLLERAADSVKGKRGRPGEAIRLKASAALIAGMHIEPERLRVVLSGLDGEPLRSSVSETPASFQDIPGTLAAMLEALLGEEGPPVADVRSIGICVPGLITETGRVAESSNMQWHDLELQGVLATVFGAPVHVGNDGRGAALAEKLFGACIPLDDYLYLDSNSGLGGALFLDGEIYRGAGGFAGEIGHVKITSNGRLCACGASGCVSAYLSEPALRRRFAQVGRPVADFQAMRVLALAEDPAALAALDEAGEVLGVAVADLVNLLNPPAIVLGGGLAVLAEFLMPGLRRTLVRQALGSSLKLAEIIVSTLAREPVPRGGLALALGGLSDPNGEGPFPW